MEKLLACGWPLSGVPSKGPLQLGDLGWWELLELLPYNQIYDSADADVS